MEYILCEFTYGVTGQFYQVIELGTVIKMTDLDGNEIFPESPYGAIVIDANPPTPSWG